MHHATLAPVALALLAASGCGGDLVDDDAAFYNWDGRKVHCATEGDSKSGNTVDDILRGLDRARDRGEVLELLVHRPGTSMPWADFEAVLAGVEERGLAWVTYEEMARGIEPVGGIALQYDDASLDEWTAAQDYLDRYHGRATIFVTRYHRLSDERKAMLRDLANAGNDIEAHGVNHLRGPVVVEQDGLQAYLDEEVQPSIDILRADGYEVVSFAYPFGNRTGETDDAVTERVPIVRSLTTTRALVTSPCPY